MSGRLGYLCQFSSRLFVRSHPRMFLGALVAAIILATVGRVIAQPNTAVLFDGNAVVTSFSGAQPPTAIPPGADPLDHTFIDIKGAVARVIDLQAVWGEMTGTHKTVPQAGLIVTDAFREAKHVHMDSEIEVKDWWYPYG